MAKKRREPDFPVEHKRAVYVALYDLQKGPISERAVKALEEFAESIGKQFGLAVFSTVE